MSLVCWSESMHCHSVVLTTSSIGICGCWWWGGDTSGRCIHQPAFSLAEQGIVLVQVQAACRVSWLEEVILDFLEVHGLREAVAMVKQAGKRCIVCTPRSGPVLAPSSEYPPL